MNFNIFKKSIKQKCDKEAQKYREIGNKHFKKQELFLALYNYNASIAYAKSKSVASLGYANRSIIYMERALFKQCLLNIKMALENEYPVDKKAKLLQREEKCKSLMKNVYDHDIDAWKIFDLSYPANEKIPWLVDCVEMRWTEEFGRGIYATRDLKPGDVICVEDPAFNYTDAKHPYVRCFTCGNGKAMNLIPSEQNASMMFCSVKCRQKIHSEAINMDKMVSADVKMLSSIGTAFGIVQNVDDFIQETDLKDLKKTIFDFDWTNPKDPEYQKNLMTCLLSLSTTDRPMDESCDIQKYVSEKTVQHILKIIYMNNKTSTCTVNEANYTGWNVGHYIALFVSLINHSCYSNVFAMNLNDKVFTTVFKSIKKGEQLLINYDNLTSDDDEYIVENIYFFQCKCEVHRYMEKNSYISAPISMRSNDTIKRLIRNTMLLLRTTNDHNLVKRSIQKVWDDISSDTSLVKFVVYCYPMANTILRHSASYLSYPI